VYSLAFTRHASTLVPHREGAGTLKFLVFHVAKKGAPLAVSVQ
jgi:hypothetical protein